MPDCFPTMLRSWITRCWWYTCPITRTRPRPAHKSHQRSWFYLWIYGNYGEIDRASQISKYSPCEYGLSRSTVGADVEKNDFFENVTTHAQDRLAEEVRLAEEARLKAEAAAQQAQLQEAQTCERITTIVLIASGALVLGLILLQMFRKKKA